MAAFREWEKFTGTRFADLKSIRQPTLVVNGVNGVEVQPWATWLLYAVLIDLTDAVAERLQRPLAALSVEMVYRSLYYFTVAHQQGHAPDPVEYLAQNADWLGVLKRPRKPKPPPARLLTSPAGA